MSVHPTTIKYYAYLNEAWVELNWAADTVKVKQGILSNDPTARIANIGELNFMLINEGDIYTPGHTSAISGWQNGVKIKQVITYDGDDYPSLWHIEPRKGIQIDARPRGSQKVSVKALDWMDYASKAPAGLLPILSDFTADEVIEALTESMAKPPTNTSYDVGINTFDSAFDTIDENASVYSELSKLALSEWGYIYVRPDTTDGETLYFENANHRNGLSSETQFDSTTFYDESIVFDAEVSNGEHHINIVKIYAYPTVTDDAAVTLFTLEQPFMIASGQTFTLRGSYTNPDTGKAANGTGMIDPVATTDYTANDASDGSGTDRTSQLSVVPSYGANGFAHEITNNYSGNVWVTKFECRGYGVYVDGRIHYQAEDSGNVEEVGAIQKTAYQKYQKTLAYPELVAERELFFEKQPETRIEYITFYANRSDASMKAFLNLGVGDVIRIESTKAGIDAYHHIQGVEYEISAGKVIKVKWIVKQFLNLALGLSLLGCSFGSLSEHDMIDYGVLPEVSGLDEISVSAWVYMTEYPPDHNAAIIRNFSDAAGWSFYSRDNDLGSLAWYQKGESGAGGWTTAGTIVPLNTWTHIAVTRDTTSASNVPIIYVDGGTVPLTQFATQTGDTIDETGSHLMVGNVLTATYNYNQQFQGYICGPRIYDDILTSGEVTSIYNAGKWDTDTHTDNLVWQGGCFRSKDTSVFDGAKYIDYDTRTVDNIFRATGKGSGYPTPFTDDSSPEYIKSLLHFDYQTGAGSATLKGSGGFVDAGGSITVPTDTDLIVFASHDSTAPVLGGVTSSLAVQANSAGHYASIHYIKNPTAGAQALSGTDVYWWALENASDVVATAETESNYPSGYIYTDITGYNLTFCVASDYFGGNLEINQSFITQDYDGSHDGKSVLCGRYTGGTALLENERIVCKGYASTNRNQLVSASFAYSAASAVEDETGKVWTKNGNAALSDSDPVFGTGALSLDGTSGTCVSTPDHADFALGSDDWTFDFWINFSDVTQPSYPVIFSQFVDANNRFYIRRNTTTNKIECTQMESGANVWSFLCDFTPAVDTWYHVAVVRGGNTPYIFIDGVSQTITETTTISGKTAADLSATVTIGGQSNNANNIYALIDEFRFSLGMARWSEDFTPPASKYAS